MKKEITQDEYLMLVGLHCLARGYYRKTDEVRDAVCRILEGDENSLGHLDDSLYDANKPLNRALRLEGVTVLPPPKKKD